MMCAMHLFPKEPSVPPLVLPWMPIVQLPLPIIITFILITGFHIEQ